MLAGLGFAKSSSTSIELLSNLQQLRQTVLQGAMCHAPMLVGPSRKGFLGMLTGRQESKSSETTGGKLDVA